MSYPTLEIILDIINAAGQPVTTGTAVFTPTGPVAAGDGVAEIFASPVTVQLGSGPPPVSADLMPTDLAGMSQWAWQLAFTGAAGAPAAFTFKVPAGPVSFTAASGTPGVLTWTATSALTVLPAGTGVKLAGGSLPAGVTAGTTYYVVNPSGQTVQLAATAGGSPLALTGSGSGTLTVASYYLAGLIPIGTGVSFSALMSAPAGTPAAGQVPIATGSGTATAWGLPALTPTAVKTSAYSAVSGDLVLADVSGGSWVLTLPAAPPDKTRVGVKLIRGGQNTSGPTTTVYALSIVPGGSDVLNADHPAALSLSAVNQGMQLQYAAGAWYVTSDDLPVSATDSRYARMVNVKAVPFSAKGDGTANDTTAIQAAINYATSIGAATYFPAASYRVDTLTLPAGAILQGTAQGTYPGNGTIPGVSVLARLASTNHDLIVIPDGSNYCRIFDIAIDGNKNNNTAGFGINIADGASGQESQVHIERCYIHDNPYSNVYLGANRRANRVLNCILNYSGSPLIAGTTTIGGGTGPNYAVPMDGITVAGSDNTIERSIIGSNFRAGITLGTTAAQNWPALSGLTGFTAAPAAVAHIVGNDVFGNLVGIAAANSASDCIIAFNGIDRQSLEGVTVYSGASNTIVGNSFHSNGSNPALTNYPAGTSYPGGIPTVYHTTGGQAAHIDLGSSVVQTAISDNNFGPQDSGVTPAATYVVNTAGTSNRVIGNVGAIDSTSFSNTAGPSGAASPFPVTSNGASIVTLSNAGALIQGSGNDILRLANWAGSVVTKITNGGSFVHTGGGAQFQTNKGHVWGSPTAVTVNPTGANGNVASFVTTAANISQIATQNASGQSAPIAVFYDSSLSTVLAQIDAGGGYTAKGLTGAAAGARFVGGTVSGAPSGSGWTAGDFAIDQTGKIWVYNGSTWVSSSPGAPAAPVSFTPAAPAAVTSTSLEMGGLGSSVTYTPASSGKVLATVSGLYLNTASGDSVNLAPMFGTGAAPANAAAVTGTAWGVGNGSALHCKNNSTSTPTPFSLTQVLSLTPSTAYWFDMAIATDTGGGTASLSGLTFSFMEN